ncbi:MAG TPA: glycosyltransferase family 4 protein [Candidatus Binatia bacterium]|nr:glycosyltransferase family 4 protein [Candidatus Binatia bacterium]
MRVLIITNQVPYPLVSGVRLRNYHLVRRMAEHHEVYLASHLYRPEDADDIGHLQEFCHHVTTGWLRPVPFRPHIPAMLRFLLSGTPFELEYFYSQELAEHLLALNRQSRFDLVHIEESILAPYIELFPRPGTRRLLSFHNVGFQQLARMSHLAPTWKMKLRLRAFAAHMRWWEPRYAARFDRCIAVSESDRRGLLSANSCLHVDVVPNGVDTEAYQPLPLDGGSASLLFIGNLGYLPCVDAAQFLVAEILPRVRRAVPDAEVWLVGAEPPPSITRLQSDGVHVTGMVSDVLPYYRRTAVAVVPLRAGGGTRLKILEAMALGRPVVSTTIGSEGLDAVDGAHLLNADGADAFAAQVIRALQDRSLAARLAGNARQFVVERYDWDAIAARQLQTYREIVE